MLNKRPILTHKEKTYLKNVIEPKKEDVIEVMKWRYCPETKNEYFVIRVCTKNSYNNEWINYFLNFITTKDMPFENMEVYKPYSLEELGL